jgi:hypothetical protein
MNVIETALPEVLVLEPRVFEDLRGLFFESDILTSDPRQDSAFLCGLCVFALRAFPGPEAAIPHFGKCPGSC